MNEHDKYDPNRGAAPAAGGTRRECDVPEFWPDGDRLTTPEEGAYEWGWHDATQRLRAALAEAEARGLRQGLPDVDVLANVIRTVDGSHTLGAGALAEAIVRALAGGGGTPTQEGER